MLGLLLLSSGDVSIADPLQAILEPEAAAGCAQTGTKPMFECAKEGTSCGTDKVCKTVRTIFPLGFKCKCVDKKKIKTAGA